MRDAVADIISELRYGVVDNVISELRAAWCIYPPELRFNPYHDPSNGRFTSGGGSGSGLTSSAVSGIINTGAKSGAKKTPGWQERHAELMYEEIRHRSTDIKRISESTPFTERSVEEIKQHMFIKEHRFLDGSVRRFDSDFDQAQAWDRLSKGKGTKTDIEMLKHEYVELTQMRIYGYAYETAHKIANSKHNWWAMVEKEK